MADLAELVLSNSLVLQSITMKTSDVYLLSSQTPPPNTVLPMVESFNKLNLAIKAVLEEDDSIGVQVN